MNNEFVSVPRERLQALLAQWPTGIKDPATIRTIQAQHQACADDLRALLAQPAAQHQEPVAWIYRLNDRTGRAWSTTVDGDYARFLIGDTAYECLPCHADTGEVERLREGISKHWKVVCDQRAELDTLRAQLAERDALLRHFIEESEQDFVSVATVDRAKAALSASAEPSAPVERDERDEFEAWYVDWFNRTHSQGVTPYTIEEMKASRDGECYGHGSNGKNLRWLGWQARAALERKS